MKTLFSFLVFALTSLVSLAQSASSFAVEISNLDLVGLQPNFELAMPLSPSSASDKVRQNSITTDIELKRPYRHGSDWQEWVRDYVATRRAGTKDLKMKYTDPQGRSEYVIKKADAFPANYKITSDGLEVLVVKVTNIELSK
jgi:hypothetical protein